jgi:hypothetical protein
LELFRESKEKAVFDIYVPDNVTISLYTYNCL